MDYFTWDDIMHVSMTSKNFYQSTKIFTYISKANSNLLLNLKQKLEEKSDTKGFELKELNTSPFILHNSMILHKTRIYIFLKLNPEVKIIIKSHFKKFLIKITRML